MPIFSGFCAISSASGVVSDGSDRLYRETCAKHRKSHDFAYRGARRSGSYVNMVKVAFQRGEYWCQLTQREA